MIPSKNPNFTQAPPCFARDPKLVDWGPQSSDKFSGAHGFMLLEVLIALAIVGIALTPILGLQSNILRSIVHITARIERFFLAEDFFLQSRAAFLKQESNETKQDKKVANPPTTLTYAAKPIKEEGAFKLLPGIIQEETEYQWQEGNAKQRDMFISYVYKPRKKQGPSVAEGKT